MATDQRPDYSTFYGNFNVAELFSLLSRPIDDGINLCVECCDRHAKEGRVAVNWLAADDEQGSITFEELKSRSARFANLLTRQGVQPGDRISGLLPRIPELLTVILGAMRAGAVYQPLFTAFGPKAIEHRLEVSKARVVVTDSANRPKLEGITNGLVIVTVGGSAEGDVDFHESLELESDQFTPVLREASDPFLMMFTSGTTGPAKAVPVPNSAIFSFAAYMKYGIGLRETDRYWNIADTGWAYGLYYAIFGPLFLGNTTALVDGAFDVERTCRVIKDLDINNLAGAPTAYRMMIAAGDSVPQAIRGRLRVASSAGEPLNPEVVRWFDEQLECPLHDHYGQTEVAMVLMNHHGLSHDVTPGSAGRPMPGYVLEVVDDEGKPLPPGIAGILAVDRRRSKLFYFPGYLGREGQDWVGDYYITGDSVEKNQDGSFSFVGRSDDLISSAGYRIGPFDVESCLIEHPSVLESGVVGKPDAERGHIVKAFVVLNQGFAASDELSEALRLHVRERLGGHAYPREIAFVGALPKTPSGKIQRFMLRESG